MRVQWQQKILKIQTKWLPLQQIYLMMPEIK